MENIISNSNRITLGQAALIAGLVLFIPTAPVAEFYVYQRLVDLDDIAKTVQNIENNKQLFLLGIYCFLITYILDIVLAWALYIFLSPVNKMISLLAGLFRLVFAVLSINCLFSLNTVYRLVGVPILDFENQNELAIENSLSYFKDGSMMAFVLFGIYLIILGYLLYKSSYVPSLIGILVIVAGCGYSFQSTKHFFWPGFDSDLVMVTFFGELILTIWLLIWGSRIKTAYV